ncbi:hypothetical protein CAPTEDRAFT_226546 [Capitella teleta]|uniref:KIF14 four-helical bundle domain-containing protein n=1 Tax=Capitella teleta TaxID=283909 RepID=R7TRM2_CAPTE|nr:hypothetical protein CAPTEDRAFT_226546 [Capitella teleta]|eukprot:ELT96227.1 hypothetical protein CAPTEDRAFT_226546 [Capitella teleta]
MSWNKETHAMFGCSGPFHSVGLNTTPIASTTFGGVALNNSEMDRHLLNAIFLEKLRRPYFLQRGQEESEMPSYNHRPTGTVTPIRDVSANRDTNRNLKRKPTMDQCINTLHVGCQTYHIDTPLKNTTPMLSLCKEMANMLLQRTRDGKNKSTVVDVIMRSCESVKVAVINILEAFTEAQLNGTMQPDHFSDCDLVRVSSMQLVSSLDLLVTNATHWAESFTDVQSDLISDLSSTITDTVKELAAELLAFLQGCENDDDTIVQNTSTTVMDHLFSLVKCCGELAIANEICPNHSLADSQDLTYDVTQIEVFKIAPTQPDVDDYLQPSDDMKQSFLDGCDSFLEGTTQSCLNRILECTERYFETCLHNHHNCEDAFEKLPKGTDEDGAVLRKIYRCTEMVQRAIPKLVAGSVGDVVVESAEVDCVAANASSQGENISAGVIFDPQTQAVMAASQEVTLATHALNGLIRKMLPSQNDAASRVKRMLPATPGRALVRCHSARTRSLDKARISRSLASFDFTHQ